MGSNGEAPSSYPAVPNAVPLPPPVTTVAGQASVDLPPPVAGMARVTLGDSTTEKKKRGRPRKYDVTSPRTRVFLPTPLSTFAPTPTANDNNVGGKSVAPRVNEVNPENNQGNLGNRAAGDWFSSSFDGVSFLTHMITVNAGEDVSMKIMQQGPRALCVLFAIGFISSVTLPHPNTSGGTLTYEGQFQILSLFGTYTPTEYLGSWSRTAAELIVSLLGADGRVIGGGVAGGLIAASPVNVILGSFLPANHEAGKSKKRRGRKAKVVDTQTTSNPATTPHASTEQRMSFGTNNPATTPHASEEQRMSSGTNIPSITPHAAKEQRLSSSNTAPATGSPNLGLSLQPQNGASTSASAIDHPKRSATDATNVAVKREY